MFTAGKARLRPYLIAMRTALILSFALATPATAWEFSPDPLCTLTHTTPEAALKITYDPTQPLYTLTLSLRTAEWPPSASFGMSFQGARPLTIGTDRHRITGPMLSVSDTGFGNVLDGLEFNSTATAFTPTRTVTVPLDNAAPEVRKFRACTQTQPPSV